MANQLGNHNFYDDILHSLGGLNASSKIVHFEKETQPNPGREGLWGTRLGLSTDHNLGGTNSSVQAFSVRNL